MSRILWGIALGAAGAFLFDPQQGRRRRAELAEKFGRASERDRSLMGGAAAVLYLYGLTRGGIGGLAAIVLGSAVLARATREEPSAEFLPLA
jgi:hypothetical protein